MFFGDITRQPEAYSLQVDPLVIGALRDLT